MSPSLPKSADVVVIGGGIIGCSTAYYLSQQGVSVVLCEKGVIAGEQSSRNWGFIRKQGRHPAEIPLMIHSLELWHKLVKEINDDIGFHVGGTLYLSDDEKRYQANQSWLQHAKTFDLDTRFLSLEELKTLIPEIQEQKEGALYTPSDARAEPEKATRAIAGQARQHGAIILENTAVRGIDLAAGAISGVVTEHGHIATSSVVCAGGAWSSYFCRHLGLIFPQLKVIGSVMSTQPGPLVTQQSIWSNGLGIRRRHDGGYNIAYGGSFDCDLTPDYLRFFRQFIDAYKAGKEEVSMRFGKRFMTELRWPSKPDLSQVSPYEKERILDPKPNHKLLDKARVRLSEVFPVLKDIAIKNRWAGMIDVTPDELPVIDTVTRIPGLILSTGYSGHGFGIGPGAGKVTSQLALGEQPSVDLTAFSIDRLRH